MNNELTEQLIVKFSNIKFRQNPSEVIYLLHHKEGRRTQRSSEALQRDVSEPINVFLPRNKQLFSIAQTKLLKKFNCI